MVTTATVLVATWQNGLSVVNEGTHQVELPGRSVRGLAADGRGGALAIVDGNSLYRRNPDGTWTIVATTAFALACSMAVGDVFYLGTDDARILRVRRGGKIEELRSFERVAGREQWYGGSAVINGQRVGPPLGIRSITATSDTAVILANVHVGGIPRSTDGGETWHPTIDIDADVHEVSAHPNRPEVVAAASAVGLCTSRDAGRTWQIEPEGLHATYCSAVTFAGDDVLVAASADHFAPQGKVYRRHYNQPRTLTAVDGLPGWLDGIADTGCMSTNGALGAIADKNGNLYISTDNGQSWSRQAQRLATPSSVLVL
jgi:hypothetical protein